MSRPFRLVPPLAVVAACLSCGREPPLAPDPPPAPALASSASSGTESVIAFNNRPNLVLRVKPGADMNTQPYPTVRGAAPLEVTFNLCRSDDPDADDSLNWQFHFGDGRPIGAGPDFEQFCRAAHVYERPGRYVATLSVTDKHLEDQGPFSSLARSTVKLTIEVTRAEPGAPPVASPVSRGTLVLESTDVPKIIPDWSFAVGDGIADSTVTAAGVGIISKVTIEPQLLHTWDGDIILELIGPDGTLVTLANRRGGPGDHYGTNCSNRTTFDDAAAQPIAAGTPPFSASFRPDTPLSAFNGKSGSAANGTWTFRVRDVKSVDYGRVDCWRLTITY